MYGQDAVEGVVDEEEVELLNEDWRNLRNHRKRYQIQR
jgi:ribosomal protein S15P/S13E